MLNAGSWMEVKWIVQVGAKVGKVISRALIPLYAKNQSESRILKCRFSQRPISYIGKRVGAIAFKGPVIEEG